MTATGTVAATVGVLGGTGGWVWCDGVVEVVGEWLDSGGGGRSVIIVTTADGQMYTTWINIYIYTVDTK